MPDRRRQLAFRGLIVTAAALIAVAGAATVLTIVGLHGDAMHDAERDAGNIATVLAEQTARSVQAIDLTLIELQGKLSAAGIPQPDDFRAAFGGRDMYQALHEAFLRLSEADVITLVGADGRIVNNSRAFPSRPLALSDRDYFRHARDDTSASVYVSEPLTNRFTG